MKTAVVVTLALVVAISQAFPADKQLERSRADKNLIVDDIRFPPGFDPKSGIIGDTYRWPNRELIYEIDGAFTQDERNVVLQAINEIASRTCVTFRQRSTESNWVFIERGAVNSGCWSYVGRTGGRQILNLQIPEFPGAGHCIWVGTAAHELIHAIGFYHEQSRPDRDDFIEMRWDNIPQEYHYAFDKYSSSQVDVFNVPYDYRSIMHYDAYAFAINPAYPTIIPKQEGVVLGNDHLTDFDIQKINRMYKC